MQLQQDDDHDYSMPTQVPREDSWKRLEEAVPCKGPSGLSPSAEFEARGCCFGTHFETRSSGWEDSAVGARSWQSSRSSSSTDARRRRSYNGSTDGSQFRPNRAMVRNGTVVVEVRRTYQYARDAGSYDGDAEDCKISAELEPATLTLCGLDGDGGHIQQRAIVGTMGFTIDEAIHGADFGDEYQDDPAVGSNQEESRRWSVTRASDRDSTRVRPCGVEDPKTSW